MLSSPRSEPRHSSLFLHCTAGKDTRVSARAWALTTRTSATQFTTAMLQTTITPRESADADAITSILLLLNVVPLAALNRFVPISAATAFIAHHASRYPFSSLRPNAVTLLYCSAYMEGLHLLHVQHHAINGVSQSQAQGISSHAWPPWLQPWLTCSCQC